jgi:hydrogenase maturation factor HypF (carbamoyltransferase family)
MILEFNLDYRSSSLVYERLFFKKLKEHNLVGKIIRDHFNLKLYVETDSIEVLEEFITNFTSSLPHSIFLYKSDAKIVEEMPQKSYEISTSQKLPLPFCPDCLKEVMSKDSANYYNIFHKCQACGYQLDGENRSYKKEFQKVASDIKDNKIIELNTFYGKYFVGLPSSVCNNILFDIIAYDLATIEKYTNVKEHEILALGSFEKPFIRLKTTMKLLLDHEGLEADLVRFKLPDDFILHLLLEELHKVDINAIFITKDKFKTDEKLLLIEPKDSLEPIEIVTSKDHLAIVSGNKGLKSITPKRAKIEPNIDNFYSVIDEHQLKDENIASINLSKDYKNNILVYGQKYGIIEYLSLNFEFNSIHEIFEKIQSTNESGEKIIKNYKEKFPQHFEKISQINFENSSFNIFKLWGLIAIILEFSKNENIMESAQILEDSALSFLGEKGPRIDYKLLNIDNEVYLDPLMTIRTAMSFRLAGVDQLMLSYGVIESFIEFLANELDEIKQNMNTNCVAITGSLLSNRDIFSKISKEISINHNIYFNNEILVD